MRLRTSILILVLLLWGQHLYASDYLPLQSAADAVGSLKVESCRKTETLRVPLRTSGAHVVLLDANGYARSSTPDSLFAKRGLNVQLALNNSIIRQLEDYMSCKTPIMCGTQGMLNFVADLTESDPRTRMVAIYQHGWSNGGAALVVRAHIKSPQDLAGAKIATQAFGPHMEYLTRIMSDAKSAAEREGQTWKDPEIVTTRALIGFEGNTPAEAFYEDKTLDAAFVLMPDAKILTSGGQVGTGAEGSVKGARILLSTKSASRVISEVYVVRKDYFDANRDQIREFVKALFKAEEQTRENVLKLLVEWDAVGKFLLKDAGATDEAKNLWSNYETVGLRGNVDWATPDRPRSFIAVNNEIQDSFVRLGLMQQAYALEMADWDYGAFAGNLFDQRRANLPGFDDSKTTQVVQDMKRKGDLDKKTLIDFDINFKPNQRTFPAEQYRAQFEKVIELSSTYGGAVLTVEGHSDPLNYLKNKVKGAPSHKLRSIRQAAKNLSVNRAIEVRDTIIDYAGEKGITLDESQFVVVGYGISEPKTGLCGGDPCPPKTESEWLSNMRVNFRIVQVEAEASVFTPINSW
jgi:hypothetical protein